MQDLLEAGVHSRSPAFAPNIKGTAKLANKPICSMHHFNMALGVTGHVPEGLLYFIKDENAEQG